jgi:hypothetical protein
MVSSYQAISAALATVALVIAYALSPYPIVAGFVIGLGIVWQYGRFRGWKAWLEVLFVFHIVAAAIGAKLGLSFGLVLLGLMGALSAWDLSHFARRIHAAGKIRGATELDRQHFQRLSLVLVGGASCVLIAIGITLKLNLWAVIGLGLVAVWGLCRVSVYLKGD